LRPRRLARPRQRRADLDREPEIRHAAALRARGASRRVAVLMRRAAAIALLCAASAIRGAAAATDEIRTWTETQSDSAPTYVAEGVVDAPPAAVWAIVSKCADYVKNMPSIAASRELSREGDEHSAFTTVCEVTADVPFPFSDLTSVTRAKLTIDEKNGNYTRT